MELQLIIEKVHADLSLDPEVKIEAETELLMSGVVDSLGVVSLIAWLEDEMKMAIEPGLVTLENFECPAAIHSLCQRVLTTEI